VALLLRAPVERLTDAAEVSIIRKVAAYPRLIETAAQAHEPHRIAFYLYELASEFHAHFTQGKGLPHLRFIRQDDEQLTVARLALVQAVVTVFASGLGDAVSRVQRQVRVGMSVFSGHAAL
jgi:arginyl-tRNA synthetase